MTTRAKARVAVDVETHERLLHAAEQLFAERGYSNVTVRDICHAARANVAAVNYHFGDKLGLYREVLQIAIDAMRSTTEAARDAAIGSSPEEQLRRYIAVFIRRVMSSDHQMVHQLIQRELDDPTVALDALIEHGVRPRVEYLAGLVSAIIGSKPTDPVTLRCVGSIMAQTLIYIRRNPIAERLGFSFTGTPKQIDEAARHIAEFSVAGIRAVAART
ncbi:MAG TPA: CerR family C-terminal domain-containing protein [Vicinamibacterales bacterium]|nr:CerR family C-terminal domain-containing protein [Vicinamibacterales bacterium]